MWAIRKPTKPVLEWAWQIDDVASILDGILICPCGWIGMAGCGRLFSERLLR
jgi:hypothetical protein